MQKSNVFAAVDPHVVLYSAFMATLISLLMTARDRNRQRVQGLPLSPWLTVVPDTLIGTLTGTLLALALPERISQLNSVSGIGFLAGFGGVAGPKLWDLISKDGLGIVLKALAGSLSGPLVSLAKAASAAAATSSTPTEVKDGDHDEHAEDQAGPDEPNAPLPVEPPVQPPTQ